MATGTYIQTNNATPTYGENSASNLVLQKAINATGVVPAIAEDSKYGDITKGAYNSLINQGYTYQNGAFSKNAQNSGKPNTDTTVPVTTPRTIKYTYSDDLTPTTVKAKSEEDIQKEQLALAQGEIANLNDYYDRVYNDQKVLNDKNTRSTNAISALTGLSGSTEADVASKDTDTRNKAQLDKVNYERNMAINQILSKIRLNAVDQARQSRLDAQKSNDDIIAYRSKQSQESTDMLTKLAQSGSGATLDGLKSTLDPASYKHLIDTVGGEDNAKMILFNARDKKDLVGSPMNVGGKAVQYYKDFNGNIKGEVIPLPAGVHPDAKLEKIGNSLYSSSDGGVTWSKVAQSTGTGTGGGKSVKSGSVTFSASQMGNFSSELEKSRGQDKYVDPDVYKQAYDAWVGSGALAKDFITQFPPKKYVNPVNNTLPSYLRSSTKTNSGRSV